MKCEYPNLPVKNVPELDEGFIPLSLAHRFAGRSGGEEIVVALEAQNRRAVHRIRIPREPEYSSFSRLYAARVIKFLLWMKGAHKIGIYGGGDIYEHIEKQFAPGGEMEFDAKFMAKIFQADFSVGRLDEIPEPLEKATPLGGGLDGCRIGFDAGGSDRKVSAVCDGEVVFSEEVVWHPKLQADPKYHFDGIVSALKKAAAHLPRVDAIGISSAGIYIDNECRAASLFIKVPEREFNEQVKDIYIRAVAEIGDVPFVLLNDGDAAAHAGATGLEAGCGVLGIAMGTSEAAGYVDGQGRIMGWLNELAFAPVDLSPSAAYDEWSGAIGCGAKYFSQDAVIRLAPSAGITLDENASLAEKLVQVQELMADGDPRAASIYRTIGVYLGHAAALYHDFYGMSHTLLMGRVVSGKGGNIILETAQKVLADEYSDVKTLLTLPDEKTRRLGQSVAAACLPVVQWAK